MPPLRNFLFAGLCFTILLFGYFQRLSNGYLSNFGVERHQTSQNDDVLNEVFNATLGFEKIFAINLPERTDHRDALILATALSEIQVEFIDGVHGETVTEKALPPGGHGGLHPSHFGAWRAHMNAISAVVHQNLSSALIFEDDVDWDIRLKSLLRNFARSIIVLQQEPPEGRNVAGGYYGFDTLPETNPTLSPYGDDWDLLWIGHCGMELSGSTEAKVVHEKDVSVPEKNHLKSFDVNRNTPLQKYPHHTRVTTHAHEGTCSLAYAVSQRGAQKLLYNIGLQKLDGPFDNMLNGWCDGKDWLKAQRCFGVIPQLFDHHRSAGSYDKDSDISAPKDGARAESVTLNIRWSVRKNLSKLLEGQTDYDDQYPDVL